MSEEFEGVGDVKDLFKHILGSEVVIKDNLDENEEIIFTSFLNKLEESHEVENILFDGVGMEVGKLTDPLWFVIENSFKFLYGEEACELIWWYVFDRYGDDGSVIPLEDENGKQYTFNTPRDLWSYIKFRFPTDTKD